MNEACDQISAHRGDAFLRWRIGMAMSVGAIFPELLEAPEMDTAPEAP